MGPTPSRTPMGSGRSGARRSAAKSGVKRRQSLARRSALEGITKNDYKRLARRAGVKRISPACFAGEHGIAAALDAWLRRAVRKLAITAEYAQRHTVIANDVAFVLKSMGMTMYGKGLDWTYGFFSRPYVRHRIIQLLPAALLAEAAAHRQQSQVGSAAEAGGVGGEAEEAEEVQQAAGAGSEEEGEEEAAGGPAAVPQQVQEVQPAAERASQRSSQASAAKPRPGKQPVAAAGQREQQQEAAAAAAAAAGADLLSPPLRLPAAAVGGGKAGEGQGVGQAGPASGELAGVPTPFAQVMSQERALEVQKWVADAMQGGLAACGYCSRRELSKVVLARHGCTAAEVQDVLFALEREKRIMLDEQDNVYLC